MGHRRDPHPTPHQMTRATHPASSFAWMVRASKDSSTVTGAHLRWLGSHARGDPKKATSTPREDSTRVFPETRVFFVRLRLPRRRSPAGARRPTYSPATRPGLAVNIVKLPEPLRS